MKQRGGRRLIGPGVTSPKVSVICVVFNAETTLPVLLKSYNAHKTDDTELVIIDGNSSDGTLKLIQKNKDLIDFWLSEPDNGIYDAMNKAVTHANGKWVLFMGADDTLQSGFAGMVGSLEDERTVYYGDTIFYGQEFKKVYDDYYLTKLNICHQSIFYPRSVFKKYQYDLRYPVYADYHLNLRLWKDEGFKFEHKDFLVASFAEGGFSGTTKDVLFEKERDKLFKTYLKRSSYYRYLNRSIGWFRTFLRFIVNK